MWTGAFILPERYCPKCESFSRMRILQSLVLGLLRKSESSPLRPISQSRDMSTIRALTWKKEQFPSHHLEWHAEFKTKYSRLLRWAYPWLERPRQPRE